MTRQLDKGMEAYIETLTPGFICTGLSVHSWLQERHDEHSNFTVAHYHDPARGAVLCGPVPSLSKCLRVISNCQCKLEKLILLEIAVFTH